MKEKKDTRNPRLPFTLLLFSLLLLCFFVFFSTSKKEEDGNVSQTQSINKVRITRKAPKTAKQEKTQPETSPLQEAPPDWEGTFFGSPPPTVARNLTVSGLSKATKNGLALLESSFIQAASRFLTANNIPGRELVIEDETPCSSPGAHAFAASIPGTQEKLLILFYPDFPGQFIFLLQKEKTDTKVPLEEPAQAAQVPSQPQAQPESTTVRLPETEVPPPYNAASLTIRSIPKPLQNYLKNPYELQYSLYNYLFYHGCRDTEQVTVETYQINGEDQTATIQFQLPNGTSLTGVYARKENTYHYF
mgnify:CR=1 FL=1